MSIASLLLFAGAMIVLFFACSQLLTRPRQPVHYCMAIGCFCAIVIFLYPEALTAGLVKRLPWLFGTEAAAFFLCAPAFYLASLTVLHEGTRPVRSYVIYFIGPGLLALCALGYGAVAGAGQLATADAARGQFSVPALRLLSVPAAATLSAAVMLDLVAALRLHRDNRAPHGAAFRTQVVFLIFYLAASLIVLGGCILRNEALYVAGLLVTCLIMIWYGVSHTVVVHFAPPPQRPAPLQRAFSRPEWDQTAEELAARLDDVMERSAPYRDEHLSLPRLAALLEVEPKRLSYQLHHHHTLNFRAYVNEWRLRAVSRDLLEDPERSILDIAMQNGFNSKSSFNSLFMAKFGRTPRDFRKEHLGGGTPPPSEPRL